MRSYLLLLAIGLLWGSQFIFMHQAVAELPPFWWLLVVPCAAA